MLHTVNMTSDIVIVNSTDTDVLILLVSHFSKMKCKDLWLLSGTAKKRKHIPVKAIYQGLSSAGIKHLISFHAVTGCDTTSFISGYTEKRAWKVFLESPACLQMLVLESVLSSAEEFTCGLYGITQTTSVDAARHILFSRRGKPENLPPPPTSDALSFHDKRSHYQVMIWHNAHYGIAGLPSPVDLGWQQAEEDLQPTLMSLEPIQTARLNLIYCSCRKMCKTNCCKCRKSRLRCTKLCGCHTSQNTEDQEMCFNTMSDEAMNYCR